MDEMNYENIDETIDKIFEEDENAEAETEIEEVETEADESDESEDEDLEYDEDGNIVIPDDESTEDGDEEAEADEDGSEDTEEGSDKKPEEADTRDSEISRLRAELERYKSQAKETAEKLGVKIDGEDVLGGLVKLAAEAEDTTPEEYLKKKAEADELEAAKQLIAQQKGEAIRRADLEELHRLFPETSEYDDISKLPNFKRFGELRVVGLSAAEAYSASHTDTIKTSAAEKAKKNTLAGTKNHLQTSVPKGAKNDEIGMTRQELSEMRETFPDLNDKEIIALHKRAKQ